LLSLVNPGDRVDLANAPFNTLKFCRADQIGFVQQNNIRKSNLLAGFGSF
jgi:hypothetical protein